jgi:hypothetical protein
MLSVTKGKEKRCRSKKKNPQVFHKTAGNKKFTITINRKKVSAKMPFKKGKG